MSCVEKAVLSSVRKYRGKYLLGISGGVDSIALYHAFSKIAKKLSLEWEAVFFHHGDTPLSEGEWAAYEFTKGVVDNIVLVELPGGDKGSKSWEQLSREQRLHYVNNHDCDFYLTGHHSDDQLETSLIQMFRGMGSGTMGMGELSGKQLRPFLSLSKSKLIQYVADRPWYEDVTNDNTDLTRNFWRKVAIPTLSSHYPGLASVIGNIRETLKFNESLAKDLAVVDGCIPLSKGASIDIPLSGERLVNVVKYALKDLTSKSLQKTTRDKIITKTPGMYYVGEYQVVITEATVTIKK